MNRKEKLWLPQFLREIEAMKLALRKEVALAEAEKFARKEKAAAPSWRDWEKYPEDPYE